VEIVVDTTGLFSATTEEVVSVIIPVYNAADYVGQTIDSVLRQTYTSVEIIVVDDGSTDGSRQILEGYGDKITYIYQENQGVSTARNTGLKHARGDYVLFLDADDVITPDKINAQGILMRADPELAIVHSGWWTTDEQGNVTDIQQPWYPAPVLDMKTWLFWKPVFPGAMLFRKSAVEEAEGFDPELAHAEDVDLVFRIMAKGYKARWLKIPTVFYRQHGRNAVNDTLNQAQGIRTVLDKFFSQQGLGREIRGLENRVRFYTYIWCCIRLFEAGLIDPLKEFFGYSAQYSRQESVFEQHIDVILQLLASFKRAGYSDESIKGLTQVIADLLKESGNEKVVAIADHLDAYTFSLAYHDMKQNDEHWLPEVSKTFSGRHIAKSLQVYVMNEGRRSSSREVAHFWNTIQNEHIIHPYDKSEVITVYMTMFAKNVFSLAPHRALTNVIYALRYTTSPRAFAPWLRFFRSAFEYYFSRHR
jgi:glycosyltransferase involved in cell wall biosynthesis